MAQGPVKACDSTSFILRGQAMSIPIAPEAPDPNVDDPTLPPPVPEQEPDDPPIEPTVPPPVGDPPSEEPPVKGKG